MRSITENYIPVKRESKAQIYARHGIIYKAGKIYSKEFGFIRPLLVNGNKKIGKGVYHFSMLPGCGVFTVEINGVVYEIKGTCACACDHCYAMTGNYCFTSVRRSLAIRTLLVRNNLEFVRRAITAQIEADNIKTVRIHAAGDFDSMNYCNMWQGIVKNFPGVVFWTYTKVESCERAFDNYSNANIVKSLIPGVGKNYGTAGYLLNAIESLKAAGESSFYVCKCGVDNNQHCTNCTHCARCKYVLFIEHGSDYDKKKATDPDMIPLTAFINAQAD